MSIEEIIVVIELLADGAEECAIDPREPKAERKIHERRSKALREAVALLRTHPEAQPNEPLTIEDLLNMSGRPVWIEDSALGKEWAIVGCPSHMKKIVRLSFSDGNSLWADQIFGSGKIYRRPPKEEQA